MHTLEVCIHRKKISEMDVKSEIEYWKTQYRKEIVSIEEGV